MIKLLIVNRVVAAWTRRGCVGVESLGLNFFVCLFLILPPFWLFVVENVFGNSHMLTTLHPPPMPRIVCRAEQPVRAACVSVTNTHPCAHFVGLTVLQQGLLTSGVQEEPGGKVVGA